MPDLRSVSARWEVRPGARAARTSRPDRRRRLRRGASVCLRTTKHQQPTCGPCSARGVAALAGKGEPSPLAAGALRRRWPGRLGALSARSGQPARTRRAHGGGRQTRGEEGGGPHGSGSRARTALVRSPARNTLSPICHAFSKSCEISRTPRKLSLLHRGMRYCWRVVASWRHLARL